MLHITLFSYIVFIFPFYRNLAYTSKVCSEQLVNSSSLTMYDAAQVIHVEKNVTEKGGREYSTASRSASGEPCFSAQRLSANSHKIL